MNGRNQGEYFVSSEKNAEPLPVTQAYPGVKKGDLLYGFVESIVKGVEPEVTADDIFRTMSVCFAIEKSQSLNQPIKVEYDTEIR